MAADPFSIRDLPTSDLPTQKIASAVMFDIPARGYTDFTGFDQVLGSAGIIARSIHDDFGDKGLIELYDNPNIIRDVTKLQMAMRMLAKHGVETLQPGDRQALGRARHIIGNLIHYEEQMVENDRLVISDKTSADKPEFLQDDEEQHRRLMSARDPRDVSRVRDEYSQSRQFTGYLKDVPPVLSRICRDLGIQEQPERRRAG